MQQDKRRFELLHDINSRIVKLYKGNIGELGDSNIVWFDNDRCCFPLESVLQEKEWFREIVDEENKFEWTEERLIGFLVFIGYFGTLPELISPLHEIEPKIREFKKLYSK